MCANSKKLSAGLLMELDWKEPHGRARVNYSVDYLATGELLRETRSAEDTAQNGSSPQVGVF